MLQTTRVTCRSIILILFFLFVFHRVRSFVGCAGLFSHEFFPQNPAPLFLLLSVSSLRRWITPVSTLALCGTLCNALLHQLLFIVFEKFFSKQFCIWIWDATYICKSHYMHWTGGRFHALALEAQWTNFAVRENNFCWRRTDQTRAREKPFIKFKFHIAKEIVKLIQLKLWRILKWAEWKRTGTGARTHPNGVYSKYILVFCPIIPFSLSF